MTNYQFKQITITHSALLSNMKVKNSGGIPEGRASAQYFFGFIIPAKHSGCHRVNNPHGPEWLASSISEGLACARGLQSSLTITLPSISPVTNSRVGGLQCLLAASAAPTSQQCWLNFLLLSFRTFSLTIPTPLF